MSEIKVKSNVLLVFMLLFQLILPVLVAAENSSVNNDAIEPNIVDVQSQEEDTDEDIESPKSLSVIEEPVEEIEEIVEPEIPATPAPEEKEEPGGNVVEEPVTKPEENTKEQPNAPPKAPETPKAPEAKPEPAPEPVEEVEEVEEVEVVEEENSEEKEEIEIEEEYDPGSMLDGFPATPHPGNPTSIIRYAPGSLGSALTLLSGARMMTPNADGLAPGEVRTSKTATPVPGMVNTWDITVRVEGRDDEQVETTDVVLVIDRSGSMDDNNRMANAKAAAVNFINTMIPADDNLRIAIVSYSSSYQGAELVTVNRNFTRNINQLTSSVNGLSALGGTHTQAGILQGQTLLTGSGADNKYMVLLSDGEPTYSYEPANWTNGRPSWGTTGNLNNNRQRTGLYNGLYNQNTIVGTGSTLTQSYTSGNWRYHIHNGDAAIRAGQDARTSLGNSGVLFTIAVQAGSVGTPILEQIATPGLAYSTQNPGELQEIYDRIATQISTQYALRFPSVIDEMGDGFTLIESTLNKTEGVTSIVPATGSNNQTINWDITPTVTNLVPGSTDVRYAEMTYRVEVNDDLLDIPDAKTNDHMLFKTNKSTTLNYVGVNDEEQTKDIESPKVDPVLMKMKKILKDGAGNIITNDDRRFNVKVSNTPNTFNHTETLAPGTDYVWLTLLRHEGTYNVEETGAIGDVLSTFSISYMVDGASKTNFVVNHTQGVPRGDVIIEVTNRLQADAIPDEPLIRVSKTFSGLTQAQIDQLEDFKVTITSQSDPTRTRDLFLSDAVRTEETNGDITYNWELEGWPAGTYTIVESGEEFSGYDIVIENDGTVTTVAATVNWTTNLWKKPNTQENNDLKVAGIPANIVATKLSSGDGVFVWTETRLSASQRLAIVNALSGWNELGLTMDNGYWYSGDDIEGTDFYFRGYRIQYDFATGNLHIPQSNQWALIVSGNYMFDGGDPADIAVKNTYTMNTLDFSFTKVDELGDPLTGADFTLEKHNGDDRTWIDNIGDDPIFKYEDLTVGTYTLTEVAAPDGYYLPDDASWTFDVVWNDETNQLEIVFNAGDEIIDDEIANYPLGMLPETGGSGTQIYLLIGMISLMALGTIYVWRTKGDEVNQND